MPVYPAVKFSTIAIEIIHLILINFYSVILDEFRDFGFSWNDHRYGMTLTYKAESQLSKVNHMAVTSQWCHEDVSSGY